ncbi:MAG TPA: hypothetical protein DEG71_09335 [Clostridiales bacterium]|nr:hypothetical protein [Clostridiales bacterium]
MIAYQQFINNPSIDTGKIARLWELKVNKKIDKLTDFCRDFLKQVGFMHTGYTEVNGIYKAVFNSKFVFDGAIQEGELVALRIKQL